MRKTSALSLTLVLLLCLALCGCGSTSDKDELHHSTAYPLSAAEYQMAVNYRLAPLISVLQPLANAAAVGQDEAEHAVKNIADAYSEISAMNPPQDKVFEKGIIRTSFLWNNIRYSVTIGMKGFA